jgi:hypothetical protein
VLAGRPSGTAAGEVVAVLVDVVTLPAEVVAAVVEGVNAAGVEVDEMPAGLVDGGPEVLGELPAAPELPGAPLEPAPPTGLVVVDETAPGVEVSLEFEPD